ncbi:MAG: ComEC/Rec2 family competence protein [bacterium]|nr:ComEC/Rec2 family competence protein [bacterium]
MYRLFRKHRFLLVFILFLGVVLLWKTDALVGSPGLRVHFFDVGQGDAEFFETPGGKQVLIDGGPRQDVIRRLAQTMPFWDHSIDLVILTHPQLDHLSGLVPVLERYHVGSIMLNAASYKLDAYAALLNVVGQKNIPVVLARAGEKITFDSGITAKILSPKEIVAEELFKEINESSIIVRLDYGKTSFLFTGDAGFPTEEDLVSRDAFLDVDVLKVGHHGSKYASGETFLRAVSPRVAVIEVGAKNTYGHPTPETLSRLAAIGATIFRTDKDATVTLETDGKTVSRLFAKDYGIFRSVKSQTLFEE